MWVGCMPPEAQRRLAEYLSVARPLSGPVHPPHPPALTPPHPFPRQNRAACKSQLSLKPAV